MGEDLDVPVLEEEKKEGILSKAISFLQKYLRSKKKWSLKKQRHRSVWTAQLRIQKKSDDEEFQEHETVDGADETTDPTTLIIKLIGFRW